MVYLFRPLGIVVRAATVVSGCVLLSWGVASAQTSTLDEPLPVLLRPLVLAPLGALLLLLAGLGARFRARERAHRLVLETSRAKFRDLYDSAPDMYLSVDAATTRVVECNDTALEQLGYSREEIVGRSILEFYHPDCRDYAKDVLFQSFKTTGKIRDAELEVLWMDGGVIDVSLSTSAVRDADGKVIAIQCVWRDITERKRTERELRDSRDGLRGLASRLREIREKESTRIAREIHDQLGRARAHRPVPVWRARRDAVSGWHDGSPRLGGRCSGRDGPGTLPSSLRQRV